MLRRGATAATATVALAAAGAPALGGHAATPERAQDARAPAVEQLVVFRGGRVVQRRVSTAGLLVRVRGRRCAVPSRTALAALVRARPGRIRLRDFAACSRRARDASGLYVAAIGRERERGQAGWVYKVGRRAATAGAADPGGPFGRGRLRRGQRVVWFYCLQATRCQRTLELRTRAETGAVAATVVGYDDAGDGVRVPGATVHAGGASALTGADGTARLLVAPGRHRVYAEKPGLVRSFSASVVVR